MVRHGADAVVSSATHAADQRVAIWCEAGGFRRDQRWSPALSGVRWSLCGAREWISPAGACRRLDSVCAVPAGLVVIARIWVTVEVAMYVSPVFVGRVPSGGRYVGEITIAGKRRRVSGPSKTDVRAKLRALQDRAARGDVDDRKATVADAIAQFLQRDVPNRYLAPSTIDLYRRRGGAWSASLVRSLLGAGRGRVDIGRCTRSRCG